MNDLTVGVFTFDQSSSFTICISNLKEQKNQNFKTIIVKNISPRFKAVEYLLNHTNTEFVILLDDDMKFLDNNGIDYLLNSISNTEFDEVIFRLYDPIFGNILGIRIYRTKKIVSIVNTFKGPWRDIDVSVILDKDKKSKRETEIIGTHKENWTNLDFYWKMFICSKKMQKDDKHFKERKIKSLVRSLMSSEHSNFDLLVCGMAGLVDGLKDEQDFPYLTYENKYNNKKYQEIERVLN